MVNIFYSGQIIDYITPYSNDELGNIKIKLEKLISEMVKYGKGDTERYIELEDDYFISGKSYEIRLPYDLIKDMNIYPSSRFLNEINNITDEDKL